MPGFRCLLSTRRFTCKRKPTVIDKALQDTACGTLWQYVSARVNGLSKSNEKTGEAQIWLNIRRSCLSLVHIGFYAEVYANIRFFSLKHVHGRFLYSVIINSKAKRYRRESLARAPISRRFRLIATLSRSCACTGDSLCSEVH